MDKTIREKIYPNSISREVALEVIDKFIEENDLNILKPYVEQMTNEFEWEELCKMAEGEKMPDLFIQFVTLCSVRDILSEQEGTELINKFFDKWAGKL